MIDKDSRYNIEYKLPVNFDENNDEFSIFRDFNKESLNKPGVIFEKNIRVSTNSVAFRYFHIIKESCAGEIFFDKYSKGLRFFFKYIIPQINFRKNRFLLITDEWTSNYYHWHIFALKKLLYFKNQGLLRDAKILLPKKYKKHKFVLPSLDLIGVKEKQITYINKKSNIRVKELAIAHCGQNDPELTKSLHDALMTNKSFKELRDCNHGDKIYISRESQKLRYVENENELVKMLERYGFRKIVAENLSYLEQVSVMRKAKYVISPHGAGLTNILFMKEGGNVLEIATKPAKTKPLTDYYKLCSAIGLNYFYHQGGLTKEIKADIDCHIAVFKLNIEKLEKDIKLMLQK